MTVRDAVIVLTNACKIYICYDGCSVASFIPMDKFMLEVFGDYIVSEIHNGFEENSYELTLAVKAYKSSNL